MVAKTVKVVNYSPVQEAELVAAYNANPTKETVAEFAEKFGKTARSVIAKLSRSGVYKKAKPVTKTGEPVVAKDETANAIGAVLNLSESEITSLAKANKTALTKVFAALAASKPLAE